MVPLLASAQDLTPPVESVPIADFTVPAGTTQSVVSLKKTFALTGVTGKVVRFSTGMGNIDVALDSTDAPLTVANFLSYVNNGSYNASFFHRSVPGFIIQGGGYQYVNNAVVTIPAGSPVMNEFKVSNTRGTIAMAKLGGDPNSATDQWFFNEEDNSTTGAALDTQNGGFTVFGTITGTGLSVMDAIGALTTVNAGSPFDQLPVLPAYVSGTPIMGNDLVMINTVAIIPLTPTTDGGVALLKLMVKSNTNPGLVTPSIVARKLYLNFTAGQTGSATITLQAKDSAKSKVKVSFTVTVQ